MRVCQRLLNRLCLRQHGRQAEHRHPQRFFQIFRRILLPSSGPIIVVTVIWQFTNIWNDFLFGSSFSSFNSIPLTVALNNLVNSSTGVKEYNVHFAGAILAALPTLIVYIVSGRYFVRGLMAGAVKG